MMKYFNSIFQKSISVLVFFCILNCSQPSKSSEIEIFRDDSKKINFIDIYQKHTSDFKNIKSNSYNIGYYSGAVWIRLRGGENGEYIQFDNPTLSEIKFYSIKLNESTAIEKLSGRFVPISFKDINNRNPTFLIEKDKEKVFYFRIVSETPIAFKISFYSSQALLAEKSELEMLFGIFWGVGILLFLFLMILFFIKHQPFILLAIIFSFLSLLGFYEKWVVLPELSLSLFFQTSFFDYGYLSFLYLIFLLFSLEFLDLRNFKFYIFLFVLQIIFILFFIFADGKTFFLIIEIYGILTGIIFNIFLLYRYKKTNNFNYILFALWLMFIIQHGFELMNFANGYSFYSSLPLNLGFISFESCLILLGIHFHESNESMQIFDPSAYIFQNIENKEKDEVIILKVVEKFLTEKEKTILYAAGNTKINCLLICIKFESENFDLTEKTIELEGLITNYLNAYKSLKYTIKDLNAGSILMIFEFVEENITLINDIYKFIFFISSSKNISKVSLGLDERIIYLQYEKEMDYFYLKSSEVQSAISLSDYSFKMNLPVISFINYKVDKKENIRKRILGKFKYNYPIERRIWEIIFAEGGDFTYLESFTKALEYLDKRNFNLAKENFEKTLEKNPKDEITKIYISKIEKIMNPPDDVKYEDESLFSLS